MWRTDGMFDRTRQRGGHGRNWKHAAVLLVLGGAAAASFGRGLFLASTGAASEIGRTVLPISGVRQVPSEYATIQDAIHAAHYGETVLVMPGVYPERIEVDSKRVTIRAGGNAGRIHIIGDGTPGPVVVVSGMAANGTSLEGLAVTGGIGTDGCGLKIDQAGVVVRNSEFARNQGGGAVGLSADVAYYGCTFEENGASVAGGGVRNEGGTATLTNCVVRANTAGTYGGGLYSNAGHATLVNTRVEGNSTVSGAWGGGIYSQAGDLMAINSVFERNGAVDAGGGVFVAGGAATLAGCEFAGNYSERGWSVGSAGGSVTMSDSKVCGQREWSTMGDGIEASTTAFNGECAADRNLNGRDDTDEIAMGWSRDCDRNGVPDDFDPDCNSNGLVDRCEIQSGWVVDCNGNGIPDRCEIELGLVLDSDGDWRIDGCVTP